MKAKHAQGESCKMYPRCRKSITACILAQKQRGFWQQWRTTIQRDGQKLFWKKRHGQILALKWAQSPILLARLKFQLASVAGQLTPLWGGKKPVPVMGAAPQAARLLKQQSCISSAASGNARKEWKKAPYYYLLSNRSSCGRSMTFVLNISLLGAGGLST